MAEALHNYRQSPNNDEDDNENDSTSSIYLKYLFIGLLIISIFLIFPIYRTSSPSPQNQFITSSNRIDQEVNQVEEDESTVSLNISSLDQFSTVQEQDEYLIKQLDQELGTINLNGNQLNYLFESSIIEYKLANLSQQMNNLIHDGNLKLMLQKIMEQNKLSKSLEYKLEEQSIMQSDFHEKNASYFECLARTNQQVDEICEKYEAGLKNKQKISLENKKLSEAISFNFFIIQMLLEKEEKIKEKYNSNKSGYKKKLNELEIKLGDQQNAISQSENLLFQIDRRQKENRELEGKIIEFEQIQPILQSQLQEQEQELNSSLADLAEKQQWLEDLKENITVIKMDIDSIEMTGNITYILDKISGRDMKKNNELAQIIRERISVLNQMIDYKGRSQDVIKGNQQTIKELSEQFLNNMIIMNQQLKEIYKQKKELLILNMDQSKEFLRVQYFKQEQLELEENQYEELEVQMKLYQKNVTQTKVCFVIQTNYQLELENNQKQLEYFYQVKQENEKIIMSEESETKNSTQLYEQLSNQIEKLKQSHQVLWFFTNFLQKQEEEFDNEMRKIISEKSQIESDIEEIQDKERDEKLLLKGFFLLF